MMVVNAVTSFFYKLDKEVKVSKIITCGATLVRILEQH